MPDIIYTPENLRKHQCVAHAPRDKTEVYFEQWFIAQGFFDAPGYYYEVQDKRVLTTRKRDGRLFIHVLDDLPTPYRFDTDDGVVWVMTWRGVWPD